MLKKILLYSLVFFAFLGFIVLPLVLKPQITKLLPQYTDSKIEIQTISYNPFLSKLELCNVSLKNLDDEELVSFKSLLLRVELYSLFRSAIHVKTLTLTEPKISLIYNKDKSINLLNIIKESEEVEQESNSSSTLPRIIIDNVAIVNGKIEYQDLTKKSPFEFSFNHIGFELKDIDTDDFNSSSAKIRLYTTLGDGGFVDFKSNVLGFKPLMIEGSLDFEASKLYTEWKYMQDTLNLEVADGKVSFHSNYYFNIDDINETKINNLNITLENLRIKPKKFYKDVLNLEYFAINNVTVMPLKHSVMVENIALNGLKVKVKRSKNSKIDWLEYIKMNTSDENISNSPTTKEEAPAWDVLIKDIALEKISLDFKDSAIKPSVTTDINELNFYAKEVTLLGEKAFTYDMNIKINEKANCISKGDVAHQKLTLNSFTECKGFDIVHYRPYIDKAAREALSTYNIKLLNAEAAFSSKISLRDTQNGIMTRVEDTNISLSKVKLNKRSTGKRVLGFKSFDVSGINIDTNLKTVEVKKVALNDFYVNLKKHKDKSLNIENLIKAKIDRKSKNIPKEKSFSVKVNKASLNGASVTFKDDSLIFPTQNKIDKIYANVYDINLKKYSWLSYNLSMRINKKGSIKTEGKLRHTPLKQYGSFNIKNLSLIELTPYLQESAYVRIDDGKLSLNGKIKYEKSLKEPDLRVEGSVNLNSFFLNDTHNDTVLLSLNKVNVASYTFELNPNRVHVDNVDIDSFYVDAMIDANKTINFSTLVKKRDENLTQEEETIDTNSTAPTFPFRVLRINVASGSAKFADYSIPLKFSTHIHDLNGAIYSISNTPGDTTYIDISGEVDKYASTRLKGSIDSENPKAYTDLEFNFKNLNLNSFSGYSATFAGHEIESGKLYLDLGYDILDSRLHGSNVVMIKQMKLGAQSTDENVTVLPLGFVIGLLEDSDGIIDIDMPVEGDLDNPDFKYGTLVWKTFGNLMLKAVTSPFAFLSSAMGIDGEALEFIAYDPGSSAISPPQREKLDQISKMMLTKPKIQLVVAGTYDTISDKKAIQLKKLIALSMEKSGEKNIKDHQSVMNIDLLEDIYNEARDDDKIKKLKNKLSKEFKDEAYERAYYNELIDICIDIQVVTDEELMALAEQRANKIVVYLIEDRMVEAQRITKKAAILSQDIGEESVKVNMEIEVK